MGQRGAHSVDDDEATIFPIPRNLLVHRYGWGPAPKPVLLPKPLFENGNCCGGKKAKQIFWYVSMGELNFGIYMDAIEFDNRYQEQPPEIKKILFRNGVAHEYFHHIVDSWCVKDDIDRAKLMKRYERQLLAEKRIEPKPLIVEEAMGEVLAYRWTGQETGLGGHPSYNLWKPLSNSDIWLEASLIVALQYIHGSYMIDGLTPKNGFTTENITELQVQENWRKMVSNCKPLQLEGDGSGFQTKPDSGVWHFELIPFHIHDAANITTDYHEWKTEFSDSLDEEE